VWLPTEPGVNPTEQLELAPEPAWSVQFCPFEKSTSPVGADLAGESVSDTVAVQLVPESTGTLAGEQSTAVEVERFVAVTAPLPSLDACLSSPPYVPVTVWSPTLPGV
jgi:hypothetical protein